MFNPNGPMFHSMGEENDTYTKRLMMAILPGVVVALVPVAFDVWKELRDGKKPKNKDKEEV